MPLPAYVNRCNVVIGLLSVFLFVSLLFHFLERVQEPEQKIAQIDSEKTIARIQEYLTTISPKFVAQVQTMAAERKISAWGCGATSLALAQVLNHRFFNDKAPIRVSYNEEPYVIVERFSFANGASSGPTSIVDHAWLEIYFGNQFLFIDPTIEQFGRVKGIATRLFHVGDADIPSILLNEYGIQDVRLSTLMRKIVDRIPTDQEPYPNMTLSEESIPYFLEAMRLRDDVGEGKVPDAWKDWVKTLVAAYR